LKNKRKPKANDLASGCVHEVFLIDLLYVVKYVFVSLLYCHCAVS